MKKFSLYISIAAAISLAFLYAAPTAHAANLLEVLSDPEMAVVIVAGWIVYALFYLPTAAALYIAGQIFNFSLTLSLNSGDLGSSIVNIGWTISRDVANLFFIFILLYIAIAVMLRLSGYGAKQLLTRLIIVALLINFSLVFAKAVIDASNILALAFYNSISVESGPSVTTVSGQGAHDLSAVFMSGFSPQKLFNSQEFENTLKKSNPPEAMLYTTIKFILASVITLMAAFILLAAAGLFIVRTVVLWIVMILAPVAFIAMILPATASHSKRWWDALLKQSFFAPAFLFFYYLVARMVSVEGGFLSQINVPDTGATGLASVLQGSLAIFMQFTVLGALLIACLVVAQEMGAYGAKTAMAWGEAAQKTARGYAGSLAALPAALTGRAVVAPVAQAMAKSPTMQNIAATFPRLGGAALRTIQRGAKLGEEVTEKRIATGMSLSPEARAEYLTNLGKGMVGGKFIGADKSTQTEMMKKMPARERVEMLEKAKTPEQKSTIENLMKSLPVEEQEKTAAIRKERESAIKLNTAMAEAKMNPADKGRAEALMSAITAPQLNKIMDEKGENLDTAFAAIKKFGANLNEITNSLARINPSVAGYIASQPRMQHTLRMMLGEKTKESKRRQAGFTSPEL